jgi:hypothetical protein
MRKDSKLKKLQLNRETLHSLEQVSLADAFGGASAVYTNCPLTSCNGCNTQNTCTTIFC